MKKLPVLYVGAPGTGKTAFVRSQYEHCEVLLLSSCVEEDIAGLPYREGDRERRTRPAWVDRIVEANERGKSTALFLDEIDKARREVADTLLTLITHPTMFGLPENTDIVAAANPPEWDGGDGVSEPMRSRFCVVPWAPDLNAWRDYMARTYGSDGPMARLVDEFATGEVPILEAHGEGWNRRLTCPRTIDMAIRGVLTARTKDEAERVAAGLLTPNAASRVVMAWVEMRRSSAEFEGNEAVATQRKARSVAKAKKYTEPWRGKKPAA